MYSIENLSQYVNYSDTIKYSADIIKKYVETDELITVLCEKGIPKNVAIDINFLSEKQGGFSKLAELFPKLFEHKNIFESYNECIVLADHNSCYIVIEPLNKKVLCLDLENESIDYVNVNLLSFFKCILILNQQIYELRAKYPDDFFADNFNDDMIQEVFKEMCEVDGSIRTEESFWGFLLEEIADMR